MTTGTTLIILLAIFFYGFFDYTGAIYQIPKNRSKAVMIVSLIIFLNALVIHRGGIPQVLQVMDIVFLLLLEVGIVLLSLQFILILTHLIDELVEYKQKRRFTQVEESKETYIILLDGSEYAKAALMDVFGRHGWAYPHYFYIGEEANRIAAEIDEQARRLVYPELNNTE